MTVIMLVNQAKMGQSRDVLEKQWPMKEMALLCVSAIVIMKNRETQQEQKGSINRCRSEGLIMKIVQAIGIVIAIKRDPKVAIGLIGIAWSEGGWLEEKSMGQMQDFVRACYNNKESRKIGLFFLINLSFMFIELTYGYLSNSLGLITDSFHMLFDCLGLLIGLIASYISKLPSNKYYTYGYGKIETLSGFFNGLLLIFTAFNVFSESIHRVLEPKSIDTSGALLPVSCIGLMVNLLGVFFFHDADPHANNQSKRSENLQGVYLHVLADSLGSLGVIVSTLCVKYFNLLIADALCSFTLSVFILVSGLPFLKLTFSQLVLELPPSLRAKTALLRDQISQIPGVKRINSVEAWKMGKGQKIVTLKVEATKRDLAEEIEERAKKTKIKLAFEIRTVQK